MSDPGKPFAPRNISVKKSKPFLLGDLSEFRREAEAAGAALGLQVPSVSGPPVLPEEEAGAPPPIAPVSDPHEEAAPVVQRPPRTTKREADRIVSAGNTERRIVRVALRADLVKQARYAAADGDCQLRDVFEAALSAYFKGRK